LADFRKSELPSFQIEAQCPRPVKVVFREDDDQRFFTWFNALIKQKIVIEEAIHSVVMFNKTKK